MGTGQGRGSHDQRPARPGRDRHQGLHGRLLQRPARRRRPGGPIRLSRDADPAGSGTPTDRPAPRRDVLPRRQPLLPALAELRQLPSGRPRRRVELGPDERRPGQPQERQEHAARPPDAAVDGPGVRESAEAAVRAGITHIQFAVRPRRTPWPSTSTSRRCNRCPARTWWTAS